MTDYTFRASDFRWVFGYCGIVAATLWFTRGFDPIADFRAQAILEGLGLGTLVLAEFFAAVWRLPKEGRRAFQGLGFLLLFSALHLGRGIAAWLASPAMSYRSFLESETALALALSVAIGGAAVLWASIRTEGPKKDLNS